MRKIHARVKDACFVLIALSGLAAPAVAEPLLNLVFSDHMVLQRNAPITVWGDAEPGSRVTVKLGRREKTVGADAEGAWRVEFPAMKAGGPFALSVASNGASDAASNIMVGDVYLCAGQSNMEFPVSRALNPQKELAAAANDAGIPLATDSEGGMFGFVVTTDGPVRRFGQVAGANVSRFRQVFHAMLDEGVYFAPSAFEAGFVSSAHGEAEIGHTLAAARRGFARLAGSPP